jgi:two-component system sensor histidine kinase PilS (NtrC family)
LSTEPQRPPPESGDEAGVERRQRYLLAGRLLVATLLLGASVILHGDDQFGELTQRALMGLIGATYAMSLLVAIALPRVRRREWLAAAQLAWDVGLVTGVTYLLGGAASGFSFLYGVVILAAALVLGPRAAQQTTAAALLAYAAMALGAANGWIDPPPDQLDEGWLLDSEELALALLRNLVGFVLVGLLAGSLSERLRRTGGQLRQAAASAAEYARLNDDILRSMASGLLTTDLEGRVRLINPAGAQMLGTAPEALLGREVGSLLPVVVGGAPIERGEGEAQRVDGTFFPVGFNCSPLRDAQGNLLGQLVVFQDLTELNTLRQKADRAERLAALGRLAAGLAHEIRNPLGSISGSVEMVREAAQLDEQDRRLLTLVLGEVDRLNDLVTTMLDIGRPRELELAPVDLASLSTELARVAQADGGPRVVVEAPSEPVRVTADHAQVRQVLWNLLKNARQLSPLDRPVRVEVHDDARRPSFSVTDEGPGIAPEDRERLFDMFFSKRRHGVGLGLALVRQIVDAHGGEITVESEPGNGARFTVYWPREPARPSRPTPSPPIEPQLR